MNDFTIYNAQNSNTVNELKQSKEDIYHNTKLLLDKYRQIVWRINISLEEIDEECQYSVHTDLMNYLNSMVEIDSRISQSRLKARLSSLEESKSIIEFIDKSFTLLERYPKKGKLYQEIILRAYLGTEEIPMENIAEDLHMSRASFFREKKNAIDLMGSMLWGYISRDFRKVVESNNQCRISDYH